MTHPQVLSSPAWPMAQTCPHSALTSLSPSVLSLTYVAYSTPFFFNRAECARMGPGKNHSHNSTFLFLYVIFLITYFGKMSRDAKPTTHKNPAAPGRLTRSRGASISRNFFTRHVVRAAQVQQAPHSGAQDPLSRKRLNEPCVPWCGGRGAMRIRIPQ